jgi:putative transposase|nr:MAG TPA: endonuclease [Caudoviricetes sp.]
MDYERGESQEYANFIRHMCYAASKLWNVCNYERQHYKEMGMEKYPDWYYQKKAHKEDLWYKQLPSQTAQEVCKLLDKSWKSFYALKRSGGIENPRPPRFKWESIPVTYMQMGIVHERNTDRIRLSLPKVLKRYMEETYQIHENFLYLENKIFRDMDQIKQLRIYPPEKGVCKVIVVYEISDQEELPQNGHYLSVDLGLHNLMTCYDSGNGKAFILGRKYLSLERYFHKEIARVQSQRYGQQSGKGLKHPVTSKHIRRLYKKKQDSVTDYLHKTTKYLVEYCREQGITCVIAGDIRNIRRENDLGHRTNQKFHSLPYNRVYMMLEYKLKRYGIRFVRQEESYTSQCSPLSLEVAKRYAEPSNRKQRGLYRDGSGAYNADAVGAYNILRKYLSVTGEKKELSVIGLKIPEIIKVAVWL